MKDKFRPIWGSFWTILEKNWTILTKQNPRNKKCRISAASPVIESDRFLFD